MLHFHSDLFLQITIYLLVCCFVQLLSCVWLFATPWTVAYQAPLSMRFPRQEYWSGLSQFFLFYWALSVCFKFISKIPANIAVNVSPAVKLKVQFDSLRPHELQHAKPPCLSPTPGIYLNPCASSWWCHPNISSSVVPFSSCPQSFLASGSFQMSHLFASGSQSIGVSGSASVLPMNNQDWFPLGMTGWISFLSKVSQENSPKPLFKTINYSGLSFLYSPNSHPYTTTGKIVAFNRWSFVSKAISLLFNMLSRWSWLFSKGASIF